MSAARRPNDPAGDRELIRACRRGEPDAFRRLFDRYRDPVYRLAYRFSGNADEAEDATQETFVRLFERLDSFRGESAFSTWLYRLAVRQCLNRRRRAKDDRSLDDSTVEPAGGEDPVDACLRREREDRAARAVAGLPETLKTAFVLVSLEGLSYAEAADVLEVSVEAVRMRMSRARRELKERLTEEGITP
jgi:RNA polymerase sigma-70 factor, ECF subfamily